MLFFYRIVFLTNVLTLLFGNCYSQAVTLGRDSAIVPEVFLKHLKDWTDAEIKAAPRKLRRGLKEIHNERDEALLREYRNAAFLTDDPYWQNWIDAMLDRIRDANPELISSNQQAYVARESTINARCYGNNVLVVDLGLIAAMPSEDEVAFVLCHELAHQSLGHFSERAINHVVRSSSRESRDRIREIKSGSFEDLDEYYLEIAFDRSRHSRYGESAADSLAFVLYKATGLPEQGPISALRVLSQADYLGPNDFIDLRIALSTPTKPAPTKWFEGLGSRIFSDPDRLSVAERDALRTHPDMDLRQDKLATYSASDKIAKTTNKEVEPSETSPIPPEFNKKFQQRRRAANREIIAGSFDRSRLDRALFFSLRAVALDSMDAWARGMASLTLAQIVEERKAGRFGVVLPKIEDETALALRPLVAVLHEMRGRDLRTLAYDYAKAIPANLSTPESMLARVKVTSWSPDNTHEANIAQESFRQTYPDHAYSKWLN